MSMFTTIITAMVVNILITYAGCVFFHAMIKIEINSYKYLKYQQTKNSAGVVVQLVSSYISHNDTTKQ